MKTFKGIITLISIFSGISLQAQITTTAFPFLQTAPSSVINSMGRSGVALDWNDSFISINNPAYMTSFSNQFSLDYSSQYTNWLPQLVGGEGMSYSNKAVGIATDLESTADLPIKLQLTYTRRYFDLGENVITDEVGKELDRFHSYETADGIAGSIGFKYGAEWFFGVGYTRINSRINPPYANKSYNSSGNAFSFGLLTRLPLHDWLAPKQSSETYSSQLFLNIGVSMVNIGDKILYLDQMQADPLPREGKIGYSTVYKLNGKMNDQMYNLASIQWSVDVSDLLVKNQIEGSKYLDFPGDINIFNHVIGLQADDKIRLHRGFMVSFLETFTVMQGWDDAEGYSSTIATHGIEFSSGGIFKYLAAKIDMPLTTTILSNSAIKFSNSEIHMKEKGHPLDKTKYSGFSANFGFTF